MNIKISFNWYPLVLTALFLIAAIDLSTSIRNNVRFMKQQEKTTRNYYLRHSPTLHR